MFDLLLVPIKKNVTTGKQPGKCSTKWQQAPVDKWAIWNHISDLHEASTKALDGNSKKQEFRKILITTMMENEWLPISVTQIRPRKTPTSQIPEFHNTIINWADDDGG